MIEVESKDLEGKFPLLTYWDIKSYLFLYLASIEPLPCSEALYLVLGIEMEKQNKTNPPSLPSTNSQSRDM